MVEKTKKMMNCMSSAELREYRARNETLSDEFDKLVERVDELEFRIEKLENKEPKRNKK